MLFRVCQGSPLHFGLKPVNYYPFCTKLSHAIRRVQQRKGGQVLLPLEEAMNKWQTMDQLPAEYRN